TKPADILSWFYELRGAQAGPVTTESMQDLLRRGRLSPETLVWNRTFGQSWKPIRDTDIAAATSKDVPPPLPPTHVEARAKTDKAHQGDGGSPNSKHTTGDNMNQIRHQ